MSRLSSLTPPVFSRLPLAMFLISPSFFAPSLTKEAICVSGVVLFHYKAGASARLGGAAGSSGRFWGRRSASPQLSQSERRITAAGSGPRLHSAPARTTRPEPHNRSFAPNPKLSFTVLKAMRCFEGPAPTEAPPTHKPRPPPGHHAEQHQRISSVCFSNRLGRSALVHMFPAG